MLGFSKKRVLAFLATLVSCAMFIGCPGPGPTPEPGDKEDLLEGEWVNASDPSWKIGHTDGQGKITDLDISKGEVSWTAYVDKENWKTEYYPAAEVAVYFEEGALSSSSKIYLTYQSDIDLHFVLGDEEGSEDFSYYTVLPAADTPTKRVLDLSKVENKGFWEEDDEGFDPNGPIHFKLPFWVSEDDEAEAYDFKASKVTSFVFSLPSDEYDEKTSYVEITELKVENGKF